MSELSDIEDINLGNISSRLEIFWRDMNNCTNYAKTKRGLQKRKQDIANYRLSIDVIATHSMIYKTSIDN
ncbi:hypothetical protein B9T07_26460 [Limnospira fusiformis CCALA 023]